MCGEHVRSNSCTSSGAFQHAQGGLFAIHRGLRALLDVYGSQVELRQRWICMASEQLKFGSHKIFIVPSETPHSSVPSQSAYVVFKIHKHLHLSVLVEVGILSQDVGKHLLKKSLW